MNTILYSTVTTVLNYIHSRVSLRLRHTLRRLVADLIFHSEIGDLENRYRDIYGEIVNPINRRKVSDALTQQMYLTHLAIPNFSLIFGDYIMTLQNFIRVNIIFII
eukprot:UN24550